MIVGILMALAAGSFISVQTMFNSKVNEAVSSQTTTALVLGMGFVASLSMGLLFEGVEYFALKPMHAWYWFSGLLGIGVVTCVVRGVKLLGASNAILLVMVSQLICALWWDSVGWFGLETVTLTVQKAIGVTVLICGLILFKATPKRLKTVSH
ncbi:membrane protein [Paenibacillus marchantiophytorum]|uniref:Membrane protein n=1 Tax=Paenibacillus marchantiophytorum TaxID=1619310 RepID=A0ABQ1FFV7_9BACL|nr:DMT family transporter [Paenibacillus marchantiophytorum]GGA11439.1 membrane protein [Paenibacillus marchantiophytorum]